MHAHLTLTKKQNISGFGGRIGFFVGPSESPYIILVAELFSGKVTKPHCFIFNGSKVKSKTVTWGNFTPPKHVNYECSSVNGKFI
jgi:hypothetical protein